MQSKDRQYPMQSKNVCGVDALYDWFVRLNISKGSPFSVCNSIIQGWQLNIISTLDDSNFIQKLKNKL